MVEQMLGAGDLRTEGVTRAFSIVPRERFAPDAPLEQVYNRDDVVITKRDDNGLALSSVSAPRIQAQMLEQRPCSSLPRVPWLLPGSDRDPIDRLARNRGRDCSAPAAPNLPTPDPSGAAALTSSTGIAVPTREPAKA
jgi:hypothetical protein